MRDACAQTTRQRRRGGVPNAMMRCTEREDEERRIRKRNEPHAERKEKDQRDPCLRRYPRGHPARHKAAIGNKEEVNGWLENALPHSSRRPGDTKRWMREEEKDEDRTTHDTSLPQATACTTPPFFPNHTSTKSTPRRTKSAPKRREKDIKRRGQAPTYDLLLTRLDGRQRQPREEGGGRRGGGGEGGEVGGGRKERSPPLALYTISP
ncbi:hypothetical protein B0H11DRAFT_1905834 [Mycena galericulata]|nr:hypothetical protein B0H11DRAFT_1905834 [Mycena galericulata]